MRKTTLFDWIATVGKIGRIPGAPGTWGSIFAVIVWYWFLSTLNGPVFLAIIIAVTGLGIYVSSVLEKELGQNDPGFIIIDEVAGQWIALFALPAVPIIALIAFVLFRIFDILKPWPIGKAQDLPGGWGVMADDVLAGILACGITHLINLYLL